MSSRGERALHIREEGAGRPILFLHALGASGRYWDHRLGALPNRYRCILPDLLGFGRSPKPDVPYTIDNHLGAVRGAVALRGAAQAPLVLVGHSLGAILAVEYAARFPEHVAGLVLLGLPCYPGADAARAYIGARGSWMARLTVANGRAAHALHALHAIAYPLLVPVAVVLAALTRRMPADVAVDSLRHTWASYSRTLDRCILHHDLRPALAAMAGSPVLLLHGADDPSAPPAAVAALAADMPAATLRTMPGGHHIFLERNACCVAAISAFLTEAAAPAMCREGSKCICEAPA